MNLKKPFWFKVKLSGNFDKEIVTYILSEAGSLGCQEVDGALIAYFSQELNINKVKEKIHEKLTLFNISDYEIKIDTIVDDGWSTRWRDYYKPILINNCFYIRPPWYPKLSNEYIDIVINPGSAFGTGTHPTTQMSLYFLKKYILNDSRVLDAGCGSGILTIAALKLGAGFVISVDNDSMVKNNYIKNLKLNNIKKGYELIIKDVTLLEDFNFDVIVSNIDIKNNIKLLNLLLEERLRPKVMIFSGFLKREKSKIMKLLKEYKIDLKDSGELRGWYAVVI